MEPTIMIITALVSGLSAGSGKAAEKAVAELFNTFISRLHQKAAEKSDAENALKAVESKPDSQVRQAVLKEELEALGAQEDYQLIELAQAVLKQANPTGAQAGKYSVRIFGGQGITIGDHASVTQTFNVSPSEPESQA